MTEDSEAVAESKKGKKHKQYGLGDMFTMRTCPMIIMDAGVYAYQKQVGKKHYSYCSWGCMRKHLRELGKI